MTRIDSGNKTTEYYPEKELVQAMKEQGWKWDVNPDSDRNPNIFLPPEGPDPMKALLDSVRPMMVDPMRDLNPIPLSQYLDAGEKKVSVFSFENIQIEDGQATGLILSSELLSRKPISPTPLESSCTNTAT